MTLSTVALAAPPQNSWKFDFGGGRAAPNAVLVTPQSLYSNENGYGFLRSEKPFSFSVTVPEGDYNVDVGAGQREGFFKHHRQSRSASFDAGKDPD